MLSFFATPAGAAGLKAMCFFDENKYLKLQ
jgi:hypothetical protein